MDHGKRLWEPQKFEVGENPKLDLAWKNGLKIGLAMGFLICAVTFCLVYAVVAP